MKLRPKEENEKLEEYLNEAHACVWDAVRDISYAEYPDYSPNLNIALVNRLSEIMRQLDDIENDIHHGRLEVFKPDA